MKIQTMGSIEEEQRPLIEEGLISQSKHLVVFTGAGISTSCGIPDFRGPKGIWTLQKASLPFHRAMPSMTHMALVELERAGILKFVISQGLQFKWLFSLFLPSVIQDQNLRDTNAHALIIIFLFLPEISPEFFFFPKVVVMAEEHRLQEPKLCANNCGFFGSTATQNLCSKCFRDLQHQQQNSSTAKHALNQSLAAAAASAVSSPDGGAASSSVSPPLPPPPADTVVKTNLGKGAAADAVEEEEGPPQDPKRCLTCRRRVGITGFRCRCGFVFCGTHRYAEQHECSFDFKRMGKDKIAKANPIVKADKLEKI